ncbi:MAG: heparin lyase I family protein [Solirubrobacterales bacterium]
MRRLALPLALVLLAVAAPSAPPALAKQPVRAGHASAAVGKIGQQHRLSGRKRLTKAQRPVVAGSTPPATVSDRIPLIEPAPRPSDILFASNFEDGFDGWHVQAPTGRAQLVDGSSFSGAANARFEVRAGDVEPETGSARAEVSGPTFQEGEDLFIRDAIRIPGANTFNGSWQIIQQLHENDWGGSPGIAVFLDSDRQIHLGAGDGSPTYWEGPRLDEERWYDLVYRVHLSRDPAAGFVEVWLDGGQQRLANGQARAYGQTIQTASTYLKAGIYRSKSSTGTSVVEHDEIVVGASLAAVLGA